MNTPSPRTFRVAVIFIAIPFLILGSLSPTNAAPTGVDFSSKMEALRLSLRQNSNYLEYTEYMMLKHKYPQAPMAYSESKESTYDDYYLKPQGQSALSQEFSGGLNGPDNTGIYDGVEIITGARAADESLQVGSIGFDRSDASTTANYRQLESALELYFNDKGKYPDNLNELVPIYIGILPAGFIYNKVGESYELKDLAPEPERVNISEVQPLEIKSHPWDSMVKVAPKVPDIFSLAPADCLTIYFRDMDKFTQLEQTISAIGKPIQSIYSLNDSVAIKNKIFKRLGIKDIKELRSLIDEAALVAYDLDAYPNTDYALIVKLKSSLLNSFIADFVTAPAERRAEIGDYYVIATDQSFLETIKNAKSNKASSLAGKQDLSYALSTLEPDYDGFAYFSEDFVKKLTGPAYRINARRRNTVLKALETLQYTVFAYRGITGSWPGSFQQIIDESYIKSGAVANLADYSIDSSGIVKHKHWGSIYDVAPVSRVSVSSVTSAEKNLYDSFKQGYQNYWREFIDPIGVSILVGDQIRFHTIILPLIDKSEYNWIKDIGGGEGIVFDFLKDPDRLPSIQGLMKINVDDVLYAVYKRTASAYDDEYKKCVDDYYKKLYQPNNTGQNRPTQEEQCKAKEKTREEGIKLIKDKVAEAVGWKEKTPVFDFLGNEVILAGGENLAINVDSLGSLDVYFGVELKDQALAKKFVDLVFSWFNKQLSEGGMGRGDYGLFKLESGKPLKNTYNNVEYFVVPLGFTNFYYAFLNNRFYMTISQSALNNLIDGKKQGQLKWSAQMTRLFDYIGEKMNLGFLADNTKLQPWLKGYIKDQWASYSGEGNIRSVQVYYTEALALAHTLPSYEGGINNVTNYYRFAPSQWFDAKIIARDGKVYLESQGKQYDLQDIDLDSLYRRYPYDESYDRPKEKTIKLAEITKNFNIDKSLADWQKLQDLGIAFNLTQEGLDIKIALSNAVSSKFDSRVKSRGIYGKNYQPFYIYAAACVCAAVLGALAWWLVKRRKKSALGSESVNTGTAPNPASSQTNPPEQSSNSQPPPLNVP
ncbi:MAG: hypothetical protein HYZ51_02265 [Candidatus Doudnabacteria bacterium]|nr:hypothetical protein [Candidatus Doudnabacteria bacterium]